MYGRKSEEYFSNPWPRILYGWSQTINLSSIRLLAVTPASFPEEIVFLLVIYYQSQSDMMYNMVDEWCYCSLIA